MVRKVQRTQLFRGYSSLNNNKDVLFDIEMVKRDLLNHFQTRVGERVMMPNFGCVVWDLLFENFTESTRNEITENITAIIDADSRVELQGLIVDEFEHGIIVQVELLYRPFEVVDTFTLEFDRRALERQDSTSTTEIR